MTDINQLLVPEAVLEGVSAANKRALLTTLAAAAAAALGIEARDLLDRLIRREKLGSTGFGAGVAIPHAKVPGLRQPFGLFARLAHPVDYDAVDEAPVDLAFLLLSPEDAGATHLKALASISRRLRDRAFLAKLRGAGSRDALYALLSVDDARDAA